MTRQRRRHLLCYRVHDLSRAAIRARLTGAAPVSLVLPGAVPQAAVTIPPVTAAPEKAAA